MNKDTQLGTLVIGAVLADIVCRVPRIPTSGQAVAADQMSMTIGGCAFNSANTIRRMGGTCRLLAPIGQGRYADELSQRLETLGFEPMRVDTQLDNGACLCLVEPSGERTMISLQGVDKAFEPSWFDDVSTQGFAYAIINAFELGGTSGHAIVGFLEKHPEISLIYAPGARFADVPADTTARIEALRPIWHLNATEAMELTGTDDVREAGFALLSRGGEAVIVTDGAVGAWLFTTPDNAAAPTCELVPAEKVQVVDTIGAGDAHVGAIAAARCAGASWHDAVVQANHASAVVCQTAGANPPA